MVQQSERKPKGEPVLQGEEGENESGDMLLQNLNPAPAYPAPPLAEHSAPTVVPTTAPCRQHIHSFYRLLFPLPVESNRSFYVSPQGTGTWFSVTI